MTYCSVIETQRERERQTDRQTGRRRKETSNHREKMSIGFCTNLFLTHNYGNFLVELANILKNNATEKS